MTRILNPTQKAKSPRCLVISGTAGLGKTQLSIAYAKLHCERSDPSYDSVILLNASSESNLKDGFQRIAKRIFKRIPEYEDAVEHTLQWLSDSRNTGWLLIFDEYDDTGQFSISQYCPIGTNGTILITTQSPLSVPGTPFRLQPLDEEGSLAVLEARSERKDTLNGTTIAQISRLS